MGDPETTIKLIIMNRLTKVIYKRDKALAMTIKGWILTMNVLLKH